MTLPGQTDIITALQVGRVPAAAMSAAGRVCAWCTGPIPADARVDAEVCGVVCRKRRWRFRRAVLRGSAGRVPFAGDRRDASWVAAARRDASPVDRRMLFAYADPPYPGKAGYYVEGQEVDHTTRSSRRSRPAIRTALYASLGPNESRPESLAAAGRAVP